MNKNNIFQKIDAFYTDITKKIIGEIPLDNNTNVSNHQKKSTPLTKIEIIKNTFTVAKVTFLNLGKPNEKELLYKEVIKREKREAKELKQATKAKTSIKKTTISSDKKSTSKKTSTTNIKKEKTANTKKTVAKKSSTTQKEPNKKTVASKKTTTKKEKVSTTKNTTKPSTKKTVTSKTKATPKTSKRAEKIALYAKDIKKHYGEVDEDFLTIIVKNLGPSIYRKDAELVSCSDPKELDTVRKNFLIKKLGLDADKNVLDAAIQDVCEELKGVRTKYRATFYYRLAKKFKKESTLS